MSCQSCLLLVLTFPSWYKCFQIKTVRLLMGKVFLMAVSLLSFHERFLSFFSVDPFLVFSLPILFIKLKKIIVFAVFRDTNQAGIDLMKRGLKENMIGSDDYAETNLKLLVRFNIELHCLIMI